MARKVWTIEDGGPANWIEDPESAAAAAFGASATSSAPGDAAAGGSTGTVSDAGHVHARTMERALFREPASGTQDITSATANPYTPFYTEFESSLNENAMPSWLAVGDSFPTNPTSNIQVATTGWYALAWACTFGIGGTFDSDPNILARWPFAITQQWNFNAPTASLYLFSGELNTVTRVIGGTVIAPLLTVSGPGAPDGVLQIRPMTLEIVRLA